MIVFCRLIQMTISSDLALLFKILLFSYSNRGLNTRCALVSGVHMCAVPIFGRMVDLGSHNATTRDDWWYPEYMEEICPGLPDWQALNACADKFAAPETAPKGRYLAGPVDWIKQDRKSVV